MIAASKKISAFYSYIAVMSSSALTQHTLFST